MLAPVLQVKWSDYAPIMVDEIPFYLRAEPGHPVRSLLRQAIACSCCVRVAAATAVMSCWLFVFGSIVPWAGYQGYACLLTLQEVQLLGHIG